MSGGSDRQQPNAVPQEVYGNEGAGFEVWFSMVQRPAKPASQSLCYTISFSMRWLSQLLAATQKHRLQGWVGLILYACAATFPHQPVQDMLSRFTDRFGREPLYQISVTIALILGAALTLLFVRGLRGQAGRKWLAALWALSFALMVGVWRLLMANNTELVHFPQYFPEGVALLALTLSPVESMAWVTVFGWLDEGYQYVYLTHGRATLLDFNDIHMDQIGGLAGIIFAMALLRSEPLTRESWLDFWKGILRRPGVLAVFGVLAVGIALLISGKLLVYEGPGAPAHWFALSRLKTTSFWYSQPIILGPHRFHELMPAEGILLLLVTIAVCAVLDRRFRVSAKPAIDC